MRSARRLSSIVLLLLVLFLLPLPAGPPRKRRNLKNLSLQSWNSKAAAS